MHMLQAFVPLNQKITLTPGVSFDILTPKHQERLLFAESGNLG